MAKSWSIDFTITLSEVGIRLDTLISDRHPELSRNAVSRLIREGAIQVNNQPRKPAFKPASGDHVTGMIPVVPDPAAEILLPEAISLDILFEDAACLALNKPPGVVVHPAPGHYRQTLANALIHYRPELAGIGDTPGRPGIVHRLDKDTSGILIVAKTKSAFRHLAAQFKARSIEKKYLGLVYGQPETEAGRIDLPIGRHTVNRKKMSATRYSRARSAETSWRVKTRFERTALMEYVIKTGRTHQIRVHSAAIKCPIIGDAVYGIKRPHKFLQGDPMLRQVIAGVHRQMLHAWQMTFAHPDTGAPVFIEAPLAPDMAWAIRQLHAIAI
ncbi:MAG: RluA family pseudouridine synthase [Desulfobacterales bacterium]|nr:RluA family pseudouridine synthase [Desulfobacterales bacterium]